MKTLNHLFTFFAVLLFGCSSTSYDYTFTEGAETPEELLKIVVEAIKSDDVDKLSSVIMNYDMESALRLEKATEKIKKAKESGDETLVKNYQSALDMYKGKEYLKKLKERQAKFSEKAAMELEETKMMFLKYAGDFSIINLDSVYILESTQYPETEKIVGVDFMKEDSVFYKIRINAVSFNGKWYYSGEKNAGHL